MLRNCEKKFILKKFIVIKIKCIFIVVLMLYFFICVYCLILMMFNDGWLKEILKY